MISTTINVQSAHMHAPTSAVAREHPQHAAPFSVLCFGKEGASMSVYLPLGVATVMAEAYAEAMFEIEKPVEQPDPADAAYDDWNTRRMESEVGDGA